MTSSRTSSIMAEKKMANVLQFFAFHINNLTLCALQLEKFFSCILFKFVMHATNKQFSDKFKNGQKKIKNAFYINNLTLWAR